uniref:EF-hand domain-containing protein n=1 Tax=Alexandrium catenella TaxID=2925 RepID=A0A7S1Q9R2_ALECA|mmetsp:Transcript_2175/g.5864  ORF Transcript_2175/g.5864 Transcript_2175/m.5864 type:complete len:204 (+) Transcript_2175:103-714(+)|eukprot:CAMPEP_0171218558 /NCGR_PEP_ID=MMETSP0790-20130122/33264_1 /TAXON_ID=2925 /ORGANISM="Alexandrium catenella, Strain OF101" /LENGTH=203 /DNA_ID=CAMNT_0011684385 /DNA_START=100 /DNA_END=711 /DNA_ORIENTATION=+
MVRICCPSCGYQWNTRPDFDWDQCVKCYAPLPPDAQKRCAVGPPTEQRKAKMRQRFDAMDLSGDGTLDFDEMAALLRKGNPGLSDIELWTLYKNVDKNLDGKISFDEFYDYLYAPARESVSPKSPLLQRGSLPAHERCVVNAGAPHSFKFGKCTFCGVAQGSCEPVNVNKQKLYKLKTMDCPEGGSHQFKFAKCAKCGKSEYS